MEAQTLTASVAGEYYLGGVPETACGFKLNEDSSFQFFFSQGALDRFGEGRWEIRDKWIVFNSRTRPEHDFSLITSRQEAGDQITIRIVEENELVKRYVHARIKGGGEIQQAIADKEGVIQFNKQELDSIELVFQFCPEKSSVFSLPSKKHNYFEFRFEAWMMELFFQDFSLLVSSEGLSGNNPILQGETYTYRKARKK